MLSKRIFVIVLCLIITTLSACAMLGSSRKEPLTIADVNPKLTSIQGTPLDAVKNQNLEYPVTGEAKYDKFFKDAAIANGGFSVAHTMSEDVNTNLKAYAQQWMHNKEASKEVKALEKNADSLTPEQYAMILEDKKKKLGHLEAQEREYFAAAAYNIAAASVSLKGSTEAVPKLLPEAKQLMADVNTAFKPWTSPGVAKELQESVSQLTKIKDDAVPLVRNMTTLAILVSKLADTGGDAPSTARIERK